MQLQSVLANLSNHQIKITFTLQALTDEQKDKIQSKFIEIGAECIVEHPISIDDINSFKNKKFPSGVNAGCFVACIFNKIGLVSISQPKIRLS